MRSDKSFMYVRWGVFLNRATALSTVQPLWQQKQYDFDSCIQVMLCCGKIALCFLYFIQINKMGGKQPTCKLYSLDLLKICVAVKMYLLAVLGTEDILENDVFSMQNTPLFFLYYSSAAIIYFFPYIIHYFHI